MSDATRQDTKAASRRLADEALEWIVRLHSGQASEEDRHRWEAWRTSSPDHRLAAQEAEALWRALGSVRASRSFIPPTPGSDPRPSPRIRTWLTAAALCLIAGGLLIGPARQWLATVQADYRTAVGARHVITLEDGSTLRLNTNTALNISFSRGVREVSLLQGEASFDVASDAAHPFTVTAGPLRTRALGTAFAVRREPHRVTVTGRHHAVEVAAAAEPAARRVTLHAGERVSYVDGQGFSAIDRVNLDHEAAWERGKLIFQDAPLADVVEELNRYRHGRILVLNPALRTLKITGVFALADPDAALRLIQQSLPIRQTTVTSYLLLLH